MTNPSDAEKHVTSHADHPALMASTETPERTPEVSEKKLVWKLDILILPLTAALYLAAFLDRGNAGNAKLQGLLTILGSNPDLKYSIVLMSFYITYIVFNVPGNILGAIITPDKALAIGAMVWGIASTAQAGCQNFGAVVVCRLFIGIGESMFGAAVPLYYSLWYKRDEIAVRNSWYIGAGSLAGAFGGLIAYGVSFIKGSIANWRILFLIEGAPSIVLAIIIWFILPSTPIKSTYITDAERHAIQTRLLDAGVNRKHTFDRSAFKRCLLSPTTYANGLVYMGLNLTLGSVSGFLPTIIASFGYTNAQAQLFTVPPYAVAFVMTLGLSYASDRFQSRGIFVIISMLLSAIGFAILLGVPHNVHARYFATFLNVTGAFACIPLMLSWAANTSGSHSAAAIRLAMMNVIGQCWSILAAFIFPATDKPGFHLGFGLNLAFNVIAAATALGLTMWYRYENRRRDRVETREVVAPGYGEDKPREGTEAEQLIEAEVRTDLHDLAPGFRYYV